MRGGSFDSRNVWLRCGCRPNAVYIRRIVVWQRPVFATIDRSDRASRRPAWRSTSVRSRPRKLERADSGRTRASSTLGAVDDGASVASAADIGCSLRRALLHRCSLADRLSVLDRPAAPGTSRWVNRVEGSTIRGFIRLTRWCRDQQRSFIDDRDSGGSRQYGRSFNWW
jgi:hypothetical protein